MKALGGREGAGQEEEVGSDSIENACSSPPPGLPDLTDDDDDDYEDDDSSEDEGDEEAEDDGRYKNQSYENGTRKKSNYAALLGPQLARVNFSMTSEDFAQSWYHKNATRNDAMTLLKSKPVGTFLIRPSSQRGCYAMTFVAANGHIKHNLIYGLFPGYSLSEKPTTEKDKYWNLTSLIRNCDFLKYPLPKEQARTQGKTAPGKNTTKSSIEVVARVVELLEQNVSSLTTLSWSLSVTHCTMLGNISQGIMGLDLYATNLLGDIGTERGNGSLEKRTIVRYCGKEYVAPELLPLQENAAKLILEALGYNDTLVSLSVLGEEGSFMNANFNPNFTDKEAVWLADALRMNTSLTNVDLSVNSISDSGAVSLAKVLSGSNRSVRLLDLSTNFIGSTGLVALASVLQVNRHIQDIRIGNQYRWDRTLHTVVLRIDPFERSVSRMIENALERRRELMENVGTYFHGFLTLQQARQILRREREGCFLFHLNENLPNCLMVSYVAGSQRNNTLHLGVVRHRALYKTDLGYSFDRSHQRTVLPLLDYCAWKISGNEELCRRFLRHPVSQQSDILEKLESMKDLFPLWKIGNVPQSASDPAMLSSATSVFPTMPFIVQKNRTWLIYPIYNNKSAS